jgi:hypothetical protein
MPRKPSAKDHYIPGENRLRPLGLKSPQRSPDEIAIPLPGSLA